nr:unnamed protein product [Callosobruchus chinensis]
MSETEEERSEPFQDSGSEYQPSILSGRQNSCDTDESLPDLDSGGIELNLNNESTDQSQSGVHVSVDECNLTSPVNLDSGNSPVTLDVQVASSNVVSDGKTRKRKRKPKEWKKSVRKRLRQAGQEYINYKGATVEKKIPRRDCLSCRFKCLEYFSEEEVALIHREFWNNTDSEKGFFYDKTTERCLVQRKRNRSEERKRTKIYSFKYYFVKNDEKIRVCKAFYLGVLSISQIRISYFYSHKRSGITTTPTQDKRGSKTSTRIKEEKRKVIRDHINMFPRVPSHYCRNSSSREYLERSLSLSKMYDLYIEYCSENNLIPEKKWLYYHIFNNEFNIGFHKPKKDLCDICTEYDLKKQEGTLADDLQEKYRTHIEGKLTAREEKLNDVNACKEDETMALMCFDMQSVLTCPQMQISKAYYKKKFAVYNLTGYDVVKKRGYCALWHELLGGRKGIDIASALYVILEKLLAERPNVTAIILWSDSCVPQNKNSHMSAAILHFLKEHPCVKFITQKFQVPGHSCVQEVDAMHSVLDRYLNKLELHSPFAIFKAIINARTKKPYKVIQMQRNNFLDFKVLSTCMTLSDVPYKHVVQVSYENRSNIVKYKLKFGAGDLHLVQFLKGSNRQNSSKTFLQGIPEPSVQSPPKGLPEEKITHIRFLASHFPAVDLQFWKSIIKDF